MSIFARRTLQRLLNENKGFLNLSQVSRHVDLLNNGDAGQYLATEWEVVMLNAFSKVGNVAHEEDFGGGRFADIHFTASDRSDIEFLADITTISDKSLHDKNPIEYFAEEFTRVLEKERLPANHFSCKVGKNTIPGAVRNRQPLNLPPKGKIPKILKTSQFREWLSAVRKNRESKQSIAFHAEDMDITLGYDPSQRYFSMNYPAYRAVSAWDHDPKEVRLPPYDRNLSNNPLNNALEKKKDQLKNTGFPGPVGIIVCDGGSYILREKLSGSNRTAKQVIEKYLLNNQRILFVMTVTIEYPKPTSLSEPYIHPTIIYNSNVAEDFRRELSMRISAAFDTIPPPVAGADNALARLKQSKIRAGRSFHGGLTVTQYMDGSADIKLSSRALLELLAGAVNQTTFFETLGFMPTDDDQQAHDNPFASALSTGHLITNITFESISNDDDDWVTIRVGVSDPAVTPFTMPE